MKVVMYWLSSAPPSMRAQQGSLIEILLLTAFSIFSFQMCGSFVAIVDENLIHDNLGSCPNLATNVQRKLGKCFRYLNDDLVNVRQGLLILK